MAKFSKKKLQALIIAGFTSTALLITGTFAWQSISQVATNEIKGQVNPGARLHDDFDGQNKDIYVENFTDPNNNGVKIYARIQLSEYMEIGADAGKIEVARSGEEPTNRKVTVIGDQNANISDPDTWHIHKMDSDTEAAVEYHNYWTWEMGNKDTAVDTYYMPTFNKDNTSLEADINGTLAGTDKDKNTGTPYDDYQKWESTSTKTQKEKLNDGKESDAEVEHKAKEIKYHAEVISMKEWKEGKNAEPGPYWVYDTDGWAYWAQAIAPGDTTGLLLNEIKNDKTPGDNYYYAIHAKGQFATAGDWSGFNGNITKDGRSLLDKIANCSPEVIYIAPKKGNEQFAVVGKGLELEVNMNIKNRTNDPSESRVEWSIDDQELAYTIVGNVFTPVEEMVGKVYKITATSTLTPSKSTTITVTVLPSEVNSSESEVGEDDKRYINFGNNVYKRINDDNTLSEFICAGEDKKIGTRDDLMNVDDVMPGLGGPHPKYGRFFLQHGANRYKAMGPDEMLGTADDIIVTSLTNSWPKDISNIFANKVEVMTADDGSTKNVEVKKGQTKQFKAKVYLSNQEISNQKVTWEISGQISPDTMITENGVLIVSPDEPDNRYINVRATSQEDPTHASNYITVKVASLGYEDIPNVEVESSTTVTIGDYHYYVMANDGDKALLLAKEGIKGGLQLSGSTDKGYQNWSNVDVIRTKLSEWLEDQPNTIKNNIIETTIYSTYGTNSKSIVETKDKVFILSREDCDPSAEIQDIRLLTAGKILNFQNINISNMWTRSMIRYVSSSGSIIYTNAYIVKSFNPLNIVNYRISSTSYNYHPAFWIKLPGSTAGDISEDVEQAE